MTTTLYKYNWVVMLEMEGNFLCYEEHDEEGDLIADTASGGLTAESRGVYYLECYLLKNVKVINYVECVCFLK